MVDLKLEIGKYYRTQKDKIVKIIKRDMNPKLIYSFISDSGHYYSSKGEVLLNAPFENITEEVIILPLHNNASRSDPVKLNIEAIVTKDIHYYFVDILKLVSQGNDSYIQYGEQPVSISFDKVPDEDSYHWTNPNIDWTDVDTLEVMAVVEKEEYCEAVPYPDTTPIFWSVYIHIPNVGIECIADRDTREEAIELACEWGRIHGLIVNDYTHPNKT